MSPEVRRFLEQLADESSNGIDFAPVLKLGLELGYGHREWRLLSELAQKMAESTRFWEAIA